MTEKFGLTKKNTKKMPVIFTNILLWTSSGTPSLEKEITALGTDFTLGDRLIKTADEPTIEDTLWRFIFSITNSASKFKKKLRWDLKPASREKHYITRESLTLKRKKLSDNVIKCN